MGRPGGDRSRWYNLFFFLLSRSFAHWLCSFAFPLKEVCLMRAELLQLRPHSNCLMLRLTWLVIWYSASCAKAIWICNSPISISTAATIFQLAFFPRRERGEIVVNSPRANILIIETADSWIIYSRPSLIKRSPGVWFSPMSIIHALEDAAMEIFMPMNI